MAKFSFQGNITGDNHQFGDNNIQINHLLKENGAAELDQKEQDFLAKLAAQSKDIAALKELFESMVHLKKTLVAKEEEEHLVDKNTDRKKVIVEVRNLAKEDKLEEATLALEKYFTKYENEKGLNRLALFQSHLGKLSEQFTIGSEEYEELQAFRNRAYLRLFAMLPTA